MFSPLTDTLLNWFRDNARQSPWRSNPEPYSIWVSEIMLQQTRVETVIPYFERWMNRFPTIFSLAAAPLQDVLLAWEGLGYYSRARNLHRAAKIVVDDYDGTLPDQPQALQQLPGIGAYTAAAIASIAFGKDVPALDGNASRVLARLFDLREPVRSTKGKKRLHQLLLEHLPSGRGGMFNQAMMDLGALVCTPKRPSCYNCPLQDMCAANALGAQEERPVSAPKKTIPHHQVAAAVIQQDGRILIAQRPPNGLLGALWEFPGGKVEAGEDLNACLHREIREELGAEIHIGGLLGVFHHAYSHFRVSVHAFHCTPASGEPRNLEHSALAWVNPADLVDYPMGKVDRQIASSLTV